MTKNLLRRPLAAALALAAAGAFAQNTAQTTPQTAAGAPLEACFVYVSPVGQAGWSWQHDLGRREMERALAPRVRTRFVENVAEGVDGERVIASLARDGCGLIVATSFGYFEGTERVAREHPNVRFDHVGGWRTSPNVGVVSARHEESRWLAGYLAGLRSRSGVAGYVAGFPVPEVLQGLNAFTLGMRAANPKAEVRVVWLNAWFDPPRERDAALALVAQGADVLTNHTGSPAVAQAAEAAGVGLLAYHSDMRAFAPKAQWGAASHRWGRYYTEEARAVLDGRWRARQVRGGLNEDMVALEVLADDTPPSVRAALERERQALRSGARKVFAGPLVDHQGRQRLARGALAEADILGMDWLVEGVRGGLPAK